MTEGVDTLAPFGSAPDRLLEIVPLAFALGGTFSPAYAAMPFPKPFVRPVLVPHVPSNRLMVFTSQFRNASSISSFVPVRYRLSTVSPISFRGMWRHGIVS